MKFRILVDNGLPVDYIRCFVDTDEELPMPDKKPNGRPVIVKVTLTEAQGAALQSAADRAGIPLAIWVRMAALEKTQRELPTRVKNEATTET